MNFYVARDKDGKLYAYDDKPIKTARYFLATGDYHKLDKSLYPEITFKNSPQIREL